MCHTFTLFIAFHHYNILDKTICVFGEIPLLWIWPPSVEVSTHIFWISSSKEIGFVVELVASWSQLLMPKQEHWRGLWDKGQVGKCLIRPVLQGDLSLVLGNAVRSLVLHVPRTEIIPICSNVPTKVVFLYHRTWHLSDNSTGLKLCLRRLCLIAK